jgi:hypothetical protein
MKKIIILLIALFALSFATENDDLVAQELVGIERLHEFLPANVSGINYCPTDDIWRWKQAVRNQFLGEKRQSGCATNGVCDAFATRNRYTGFSIQIPLYITVICQTATTCPFNEARVNAQIQQVNQDFSGTGISFVISTTRFVTDAQYFEIDAYSQFNNNWYNQIIALKNKYAFLPNNFLNCFVTRQKSGTSGTLLGIGTFPWDTASNTNTGGLWMNANYVGAGYKTFAHEIGHCVGLWHTFHGDSEVSCNSACYETVHQDFGDTTFSNSVGDFCADTPAQPMNYQCSIPSTRDCKGLLYRDCPTSQQPAITNNIMSYTPDTCMMRFTPQQSTRALCWTCSGRVRNWVNNQCPISE